MPININKIITRLKNVIFSFKKTLLKSRANNIDVSRKDETTAIGK